MGKSEYDHSERCLQLFLKEGKIEMQLSVSDIPKILHLDYIYHRLITFYKRRHILVSFLTFLRKIVALLSECSVPMGILVASGEVIKDARIAFFFREKTIVDLSADTLTDVILNFSDSFRISQLKCYQ